MIISTNNKDGLDLYWNKKYIGQAYKETSGHYVFQLKNIRHQSVNSYLNSNSLREIATKLDELNKDWHAKIWDEFIKKQTGETLEDFINRH